MLTYQRRTRRHDRLIQRVTPRKSCFRISAPRLTRSQLLLCAISKSCGCWRRPQPRSNRRRTRYQLQDRGLLVRDTGDESANVDVVFRFARDSPLEEDGFEPSVPRQKDVCIHPDHRRSEVAEPQIGGCRLAANDRARARARRLDGKAFMPRWPPILWVGRSGVSPKIRPDSNFWGAGLFCVGFICKHRRIPAPRMADGLRTKERRLK